MSVWSPSPVEVARHLRYAAPLSSLDEASLRAVAAVGRSRTLAAGEILRSSREESVVVVVAGALSVRRSSNAGQVAVLTVVRPGEVHGLSSVFGGNRERDLVREAAVPSRVVELPGPVVVERILLDRGVTEDVLRHLSARQLEVEDRLLDTLLLPKSGLVVRMLDRFAVAEAGSFVRSVRATHQELAWFAGCTRETATVVISRLREEGIVATRPGHIEILDDDRLANWRDSG